MNISINFSSAKKPSGAVNRVHEDDQSEKKEFLNEFNAGHRAADADADKAAKVIPVKPNKLHIGKHEKKDAKDIGKLEDKFEVATQQKEGDGIYGLISKTAIKESVEPAVKHKVQKSAVDGLEDLPDEPQLASYQTMPIEDFGRALLMGMGMKAETNVPTVEYIARPARMGLGVKPADVVTGKRSYKQMVAEDGSIKSVIREGDKVIDTATLGPRKGKKMTIASGRHAGLQCVVRDVDVDGETDMIRVRLLPSEHDVVVSAGMLAEPGAPVYASGGEARKRAAGGREADRQQKGPQTGRDGGARGRDRSERGDDRDGRKGGSGVVEARRDEGAGREGGRGPSWLCENIKVRVVDKDVARGRLYLKKAVVLSLLGGGSCAARMCDTGHVEEGLRASQLETVVPKKPGCPLIILRGSRRGRHARLLDKRFEAAAVQLTDDMEVVNVSLDDIAEYVGDLEGEDF